ncbi:MAG: hypothetical protein ABIC57_01480 [bacterium]
MASKVIVNRVFTLIIVVAIGCAGYLGYKYYVSQSSNITSGVDNNSTVGVYISDEIPSSLSEIIKTVIEEKGWEITESNPDISVEVNSKEEEYQTIYQYFAVTKPWSLLADIDLETFSQFSSMIDKDTFDLINQDDFIYDSNSNSNYLLQSFSELDGTRLAVEINNKSIFDKSWWQEKNYPLALEIKISGDREELISELSINQKFIDAGYTTK